MEKSAESEHDHDDSAVLDGNGGDRRLAPGTAPLTGDETAPPTPASSAKDERTLRLRALAFVVWAVAFVPLFVVLRSWLSPLTPIQRSLIGAGVFCASAVAALWFLGRERRATLRAWQLAFLLWAVLFLPVLLSAAEGIASEGWPRGRHNEVVGKLLILDFTLTVPALVTSVCALIKSYRVTSAVALATGLTYLVNGVLLIRATAPSKGWWFDLGSPLNIILTGAKMGSYLSIPVGIAFVMGAVMIFRSVRAEPLTASSSR